MCRIAKQSHCSAGREIPGNANRALRHPPVSLLRMPQSDQLARKCSVSLRRSGQGERCRAVPTNQDHLRSYSRSRGSRVFFVQLPTHPDPAPAARDAAIRGLPPPAAQHHSSLALVPDSSRVRRKPKQTGREPLLKPALSVGNGLALRNTRKEEVVSHVQIRFCNSSRRRLRGVRKRPGRHAFRA